jgi:hypothetical protein
MSELGIDNSQPAVAQRDAFASENSITVRAAVGDCRGHALDLAIAHWLAFPSDDSGDSAHLRLF